jgi:ATP-dependent HslUV protease ATP-binding subunit HslU
MAIKSHRERAIKANRARAEDAAEERILDVLLPPARSPGFFAENSESTAGENATRQKFRKKLREGELDDKEIDIELAAPAMQAEIFAPPGMEELTQQIQGMFQNMGGGKKKSRKLKIPEALKLLTDEEAAKLVNDEEIKLEAVKAVEQNGIVFLDELDKIASRSDVQGADVSRQGVQRDLLPLVEGTTVSTKYGMIRTDHILFIASGAFHLSKPSDLIPELQGRFPIRVELDSLSVADFECILTQTDACLTRQYQALLATEGVAVEFRRRRHPRWRDSPFQVIERDREIGARRLHTVMESCSRKSRSPLASPGWRRSRSTPPTSMKTRRGCGRRGFVAATCCKGISRMGGRFTAPAQSPLSFPASLPHGQQSLRFRLLAILFRSSASSAAGYFLWPQHKPEDGGRQTG